VAEPTHVFLTEEGESGFSAESPQVPGFAFGRPTKVETVRDLYPALNWAGAIAPLTTHVQHRGVSPEGVEWIIRLAEDTHRSERVLVAQQIEGVLLGDDRQNILDYPRTKTGEVVFVSCLPDDPLGFVVEQLWERPDSVVVALADGPKLWTIPVGNHADDPEWRSFDELGVDMKTTVGELRARNRDSSHLKVLAGA
jgi:hypothetical protein